nr:hypothetical protein [Deltaproteobacteria bacterium]
RVRIVPPPNSSAAAVFDEPIELGGELSKTLANRVALGGIAVDSTGAPLGGVAVTVHPSLRFTWSLDDRPQSFLSEIPAATAVTTNTGEFVVFVDPIIAETWGAYDLVFEPTLESRAGNWLVADIALPRDAATTSVMLDPIAIPDAAFVHGRILDPDGIALEDAELKLFRVVAPSGALCLEVNHAPASCPIPATLQGRGASDHDGVVRLTLPRPTF